MDSAGPNLPHYGSTSPLRLILSFGISAILEVPHFFRELPSTCDALRDFASFKTTVALPG